MHIEITKEKDGTQLSVLVHVPRIDGSGQIADAMREYEDDLSGVESIEVDFKHVDYLNSMGITELVNMYRIITDKSRGRITFRFVNVKSKIHSILELVEFTKIVDVNPV